MRLSSLFGKRIGTYYLRLRQYATKLSIGPTKKGYLLAKIKFRVFTSWDHQTVYITDVASNRLKYYLCDSYVNILGMGTVGRYRCLVYHASMLMLLYL